jgi:hypothetical protein
LVHYEDDVAIQLGDWVVNPAEAPGYLEQDFTAITPDSYLSAVSRREPCLLSGDARGLRTGSSVPRDSCIRVRGAVSRAPSAPNVSWVASAGRRS